MKIEVSLKDIIYNKRVKFADRDSRPIFGDQQTCFVSWLDDNKQFHGIALVQASSFDKREFGRGVFRAGKGEMRLEAVVKIDPKEMRLYFVDNEHYAKTDKVQWDDVKIKELIIFNKTLFEDAYRR